MNAPEQAIKIYRGDDTDWNGETLLNFTVTADFDISDFTAEFLLGGISKKNISLAEGGNFEVNFSHEETAQMPWGLNKGILKIFDTDKRIKTVTNDILFWVTNEPVGEQTESIIVPVPETSPVQITLQIGGGSSGGGAWGSITGNIENQADLQAEFAEVQGQIDAIDGLIPAQASTDNKLADKNFVNSSISTNTAYFIGTFESVEELEAYSGTVTNNDYAFVVGTDSDGNTVYNRYKYTTATTPASWLFEYALNNSSFTAAQWAAIQSGITSADVTQIGTNTTNISAKQPKTLETPLTIGGTSQTTVEGALGGLNTEVGKKITNLATGTDSITIIGTPTSANEAVNIGVLARATSNRSIAIGASSYASASKAIAIGQTAFATNENSVSIGGNSYANQPSAIAIGGDTTISQASANSAIQLGAGENNNAKTLQVFEYQLLNGNTGKIPSDRLPAILPDQTDQSGKFLTTDGTTVSWAEVTGGGGLNAVYDSGTETLTFTSSTPPEPPITSHYTFDGNGNLIDCDDKVFLRSSGTQRIDTGITVSDSNKLDIKFKLFLGDLCTLCGIYNTNTSTQYSTNSAVFATNYGDTRILKTNGRVAISPASGEHHLIISSTNVTLDESVLSWSSDSGNSATGNLNIFAGKFASAISYGRLSINRFKIYDSSNNLLRDFVPVKEGMEIGGNTLMSNGLWDIVNQTFYGNLGSGAFDFHVEE